jgi:hypothetical protein
VNHKGGKESPQYVDNNLVTYGALAHCASYYWRHAVFKVGYIFRPSMQGFTPLTSACCIGHVAIVKLLLMAGADVNEADGCYEDGYVRG